MELMLIVYAVSILTSLGAISIGVLMTYLVAAGMSALICLLSEGEAISKDQLRRYFWRPKSVLSLLLFIIMLPSETTIKYMAGAYLLQEAATSNTAKEIGTLSAEAVKSQLKLWAKDNEELTLLIDAANVPVEDK